MPPMNRDLAYYEGFLEIMADEINVKQVIIQGPFEGLELVYHHDTINGGGYSEVRHNGKVVHAPKTALILAKSFVEQSRH
jgi:hypothetical protein